MIKKLFYAIAAGAMLFAVSCQNDDLTGAQGDVATVSVAVSTPEIATRAGHHSVIHNPKSDKYYIVYHRRPLGSDKRDNRVTCIDEMHFAPNGDILPVKMTFEGVKKDKL